MRQVATRFGAMADVQTFVYDLRGEGVEAVGPAVRDWSPHVIIADPQPAVYLAERAHAEFVPFELTAEGLAARIEGALQAADAVGVLLRRGCVSPSLLRLLRRMPGAVRVLFWDRINELPVLVMRCRRMGLKAVIGGGSVVALARAEGLDGFSIYETSEEPGGVMSHMLFKAAIQYVPRLMSQLQERIAAGLILQNIYEGAIGPHDRVLCLGRDGLVTATFAHDGQQAGQVHPVPTFPIGVPVMEALAVSSSPATAAEDATADPVAVDFYPLAPAGGEGCVVVVRGAPRQVGVLPGDTRAAGLGAEHVETLLQRLDTLLERTDALARARRPRSAPRRFLASLRRRQFLLDWHRVRYFELRSGLVFAEMIDGQSFATNYAIADILARADPRDFFRVHRHVIVNLNHVTEVERVGQGQLRLVVEGPNATTTTLLVSRPASAALRKLLKA